MIKIGICEDEKWIAAQLEKILLEVCHKESIPVDIDVFAGGHSLEQEVQRGTNYDLLFLDIQMEQGDGIEAAKVIREKDANVLFVFVSGYDKYLIDLFRLDVFAFMKKPIDEKGLIKIFLEANQKIGNKKFYFSFRYKNEEYKVPCHEILYFESRGRKVQIHLRGGEMEEFNGKLSEVMLKLEQGKIPFLRIHQSYLVNYHLIRSRTKAEVTLVNGKKLPISEERQKEFGRRYSALLGGEIEV